MPGAVDVFFILGNERIGVCQRCLPHQRINSKRDQQNESRIVRLYGPLWQNSFFYKKKRQPTHYNTADARHNQRRALFLYILVSLLYLFQKVSIQNQRFFGKVGVLVIFF